MIENPILPGFNPDPSICWVGDEYFTATFTFEWYPGVQIHRSTDLQSWELVKRPRDRAEQLDLSGVQDSCGVWVPSLIHAGDSAEFLGSEEAIADYLLAASEDGDANHIARALGVVARARDVRSFPEYRTYTACSLPGIKWGLRSRVWHNRKGS